MHIEDVIAVKSKGLFRIFIFPRDTRRLAEEGKFGGMASFECGGSIVLSYQPRKAEKGRPDERRTFNEANLDTARKLLTDVAPTAGDRTKLFSNW